MYGSSIRPEAHPALFPNSEHEHDDRKNASNRSHKQRSRFRIPITHHHSPSLRCPLHLLDWETCREASPNRQGLLSQHPNQTAGPRATSCAASPAENARCLCGNPLETPSALGAPSRQDADPPPSPVTEQAQGGQRTRSGPCSRSIAAKKGDACRQAPRTHVRIQIKRMVRGESGPHRARGVGTSYRFEPCPPSAKLHLSRESSSDLGPVRNRSG